MDYASFLHQQVAALVEQYFANTNIAWIAVPDLEWLTRRQSMDGGQVTALPGFASDEGIIWRDAKGRVELWARAEEKATEGTDLYNRAWREFVKLNARTQPMSDVNGRKLQVDHLYPETAAARLGLSHVRLLPFDARPNRTVGSTVEKAAAGPKPGTLRPRFATPFTLAKASGFQQSFARRNNSADVARALWDYLKAQGYPVSSGALAALDMGLTASTLDWFRGDR
jgi:hypothetical protein